MEDLHAPSPEFTRFLEWQTRTELRREVRFARESRVPARVLRAARVAALTLVALFVGAGAAMAVEHVHESRELEVLLVRNSLLLRLAERRSEGAREVLQATQFSYEHGDVPISALTEAMLRVREFELERDHRTLDGEEMEAARRAVDVRLTAPLVGVRDFVSERLRIDRNHALGLAEFRQEAHDQTLAAVQSGLRPAMDGERAKHALSVSRRHVERLDERLELRADYLMGRMDEATCERRDLIADARHRRVVLESEQELLQTELRIAELQEASGLASGAVAPLKDELDRIEVELSLVQLELGLLR